jgi:hypothetical protein
MSGNRQPFDTNNSGFTPFWAAPASSSTSSKKEDAAMDNMDDDIDALTSSFQQVSVQETIRTLLTTNSNFNDLSKRLPSAVQIGGYKDKTLIEADIIADRIQTDLISIAKHHGPAKSEAQEQQRLLIVHVVQAYKRCLELDIHKWKVDLKLKGKSDSDIAAIQPVIRTFVPWEQRKNLAPAYNASEQLQNAKCDTESEQIAYIQMTLNYWRSCYFYIGDYEKLVGANQHDIEKMLWQLEQTTLSYLQSTNSNYSYDDLNRTRLREPSNINPMTGQPMSIAAVQEQIRQQQAQTSYKSMARM